jgi:hypothetical protein
MGLRAAIDPRLCNDLAACVPGFVVDDTRESAAGFCGGAFGNNVSWRFSALRDLAVGTASAGGNLVGRPNAAPVSPLDGFSTLTALGMQTISIPAGQTPHAYPVLEHGTEVLSAGFANGEFGTVPQAYGGTEETAPGSGIFEATNGNAFVFRAEAPAPKTLGLSVLVSRKLILQGGPAAERIISQGLMWAVARGIDRAVIQGSGIDGNPLGLLNRPGIQTTDQYPTRAAALAQMAAGAMRGGGVERYMSWVMSAHARTQLALNVGYEPDLRDGKVQGLPAHVSAQCPDTGVLVGDWRQAAVVLHGGVQLQIDPRFNAAGTHRLVVLVDVDVLVLQPGAFARENAADFTAPLL